MLRNSLIAFVLRVRVALLRLLACSFVGLAVRQLSCVVVMFACFAGWLFVCVFVCSLLFVFCVRAFVCLRVFLLILFVCLFLLFCFWCRCGLFV